MPQLTPQQIAYYAYNAGFRGEALNYAVAIALAESGGRTDAYNPELAAGTKTGSGSRGLWQIYGTAHPWANNSQVFDPQINANAAFRVFREAGNRFSPWSTYNLGVKPTFDFSRTVFKKGQTPRSSPVAQIARGSSAPILAGQPIQMGVGGGVKAETPTLRSFLGLAPAPSNEKAKGPEDVAAILIGATILLIGILALLITGITGAQDAQGKFIMKNASKIAGIL